MNKVEIQDLEEEINKRQKELENLKKLLKAKSVIWIFAHTETESQ